LSKSMSSTKSIPVITKFWFYGTNLVSPRVFVIIQFIIHSRPNFTVQPDLNQLGYHNFPAKTNRLRSNISVQNPCLLYFTAHLKCILDKTNKFGRSIGIFYNQIWVDSQTCLQRPPLGPQNAGRCRKVASVRRFFNQNRYWIWFGQA